MDNELDQKAWGLNVGPWTVHDGPDQNFVLNWTRTVIWFCPFIHRFGAGNPDESNKIKKNLSKLYFLKSSDYQVHFIHS